MGQDDGQVRCYAQSTRRYRREPLIRLYAHTSCYNPLKVDGNGLGREGEGRAAGAEVSLQDNPFFLRPS